jgi:GTP-binding protein HflX
LRLPREQEVIVNDTVGFIRDLPPDLLSAFRATLEEINDSDVLIHLLDASNPRWQQQLESVERILGELDYGRIPRLLVFNKADLVASETLQAMMRQASQNGARECISISATEPQTLRPMLERTGAMLALNLVERPGAQAEPLPEEEEEYTAQSAK